MTTTRHAALHPAVLLLLVVTAAVLLPGPAATAAGPDRPARIGRLTGSWVAHTRDLHVRRGGVVLERVGSGCCDPVVDVVLEIGGVGGTRSAPRADAVVRQVVVHDPTAFDAAHPAPYVGESAVLRIDRRGILHESATRTLYCDPHDYHPACGA